MAQARQRPETDHPRPAPERTQPCLITTTAAHHSTSARAQPPARRPRRYKHPRDDNDHEDQHRPPERAHRGGRNHQDDERRGRIGVPLGKPAHTLFHHVPLKAEEPRDRGRRHHRIELEELTGCNRVESPPPGVPPRPPSHHRQQTSGTTARPTRHRARSSSRRCAATTRAVRSPPARRTLGVFTRTNEKAWVGATVTLGRSTASRDRPRSSLRRR